MSEDVLFGTTKPLIGTSPLRYTNVMKDSGRRLMGRQGSNPALSKEHQRESLRVFPGEKKRLRILASSWLRSGNQGNSRSIWKKKKNIFVVRVGGSEQKPLLLIVFLGGTGDWEMHSNQARTEGKLREPCGGGPWAREQREGLS